MLTALFLKCLRLDQYNKYDRTVVADWRPGSTRNVELHIMASVGARAHLEGLGDLPSGGPGNRELRPPPLKPTNFQQMGR